jgi:hypothetical protein
VTSIITAGKENYMDVSKKQSIYFFRKPKQGGFDL